MRRTLLLAPTAMVFFALASPAQAEDAWADLEVVDEADLDEMRGGFAVNGVEIGFGAVVTTYADGVMALTTQLTWTDAGLVVAETLGNLGQTIDSLTPEQRAALGVEGVTGGVVIADEAGLTALVHNVTEGALQNVILNNASGRDLQQDVDVTITLPGFESVQEAMGLEIFGLRVGDDLANMLAGDVY